MTPFRPSTDLLRSAQRPRDSREYDVIELMGRDETGHVPAVM